MSFGCIIVCSVISAPSVIINLIALILIIFHSAPTMKSYKYLLLYLIFYDFLLSFGLLVFFQPEVYFPALVVKVKALGTYLGEEFGHFMFAFSVFCGGQIIVCIDLCISYRYYALVGSSAGKEYTSTTAFKCHMVFSYVFVTASGYLFRAHGQRKEEYIAYARAHGQLHLFEEDLHANIFCFNWRSEFYQWAVTIVPFLFFLYTIVKNVYMFNRIYSYLRNHSKFMSHRTAAMHRKLTFLLALQIGYPFVSLTVPVCLFGTSLVLGRDEIYGSKIFQWIIYGFMISLPLFNGISTICFVTPYRRAFVSFIRKKSRNQENAFPSSSRMSYICIIICTALCFPSVLINGIAFILIIWHSPSNMQSYKYLLLHMIVYDFLMSFILLVFVQPEVFFPAFVGKVNGLGVFMGENSGHYLMSGCVFCGAQLLMSINLCISHRYYSVLPNKKESKYHKTLQFRAEIAMSYISCSVVSVLLFMLGLNKQDYIAFAISENIYRYFEDAADANIFGYSLKFSSALWSIAACLSLMFGHTLVKNLFMFYKIYSFLAAHSGTMTSKTAQMHRRLTVLLFVQIAYPFVSLSIPVAGFLGAVFLQLEQLLRGKALQWLLYAFILSLPLVNGATTIWFVVPYRKTLLRLFHLSEKRTNAAILMNVKWNDTVSLNCRPHGRPIETLHPLCPSRVTSAPSVKRF